MSGKKKNAVAGDLERSQEAREQSCKYLVEATSFERQALYERWTGFAVPAFWKLDPIEWTSIQSGAMFRVGVIGKHQKDRVVWVAFTYALIEGQLVGFYEATSRYVDHDMVEKFVKKSHPKAKTVTDATNFHLVAHEIGDKRK